MSTVHIKAEITPQNLVAALKKLPPAELDTILREVRTARTASGTDSLTAAETKLLDRINNAISPEAWREYKTLRLKLDSGTLNELEHARLIALTDRIEELQADRIQAVADMAALRDVPFGELWRQLGLGPTPNA